MTKLSIVSLLTMKPMQCNKNKTEMFNSNKQCTAVTTKPIGTKKIRKQKQQGHFN